MNLKLIGHFTSAHDAKSAVKTIETLAAAADAEHTAGRLEYGEPPRMFSEELLAVLRTVDLYSLSYGDIEQFLYDTDIKAVGNDVIVQTDEVDVIAFVKVFLARGAKVQMYSMHDHSSGIGEQ